MRIIAGYVKGMPLAVPRRGVRPTSDRTRAAIFSSLGERVMGARVLDLFAGTGALGLEAASRGATDVTFVESAPDALETLEGNVAEFVKRLCGAGSGHPILQIQRGDVANELARLAAAKERFQVIFADPPYGAEAQALLADEMLPGLLSDGGVLVLESSKRDMVLAREPWELFRGSTYGDTRVDFCRAKL